MLKIIAREAIRDFYFLKRAVVWYDRKFTYPKHEPSDIFVNPNNLQFRLLANDVDSYQDAINVFNLIGE